jgi:DNA-binding transcriptional MerR regulator
MSKYEIDEETGEVLFNHSTISAEDVVDRLNDLEAKLAEYEKFMKGNKFNNIQDVQNAINGIFQDIFDEKHKVWISICDKWAKCEQENKQLKQQLAEAEAKLKEIKGE